MTGSTEDATTPAEDMDTGPELPAVPKLEGLKAFLATLRDHGLVKGKLRGVLHIAIGRRVENTKGDPVSNGVTWRELAGLLKAVRLDKELGREVGADPETLSPRDRERFWYSVIGLARVDGSEALAQAESLAGVVKSLGYKIGPSPVKATPLPMKPLKVDIATNDDKDDAKKKKKK